MEKTFLEKEFNRQIENLIKKSYPKKANFTKEEFTKLIQPLQIKLEKLALWPVDLEIGRLPFVIVVRSDLVSTEDAMDSVNWKDKNGMIKLYPHESYDFKPINSVNLPKSSVYVLVNIDRGKNTINLPPSKAMEIIVKQSRSPLTIDEGIAIVTHFPEFLKKNNCFSLLASRHTGDKRVPAIWINAKKQPHLGWCWDGNPHTWLGSASSERRIGL